MRTVPRHCVVLAGGLGTRLQEITGGAIPKVMVPVLGRPFLSHKIDQLIELGVDEITLLLGQHADQVIDYVDQIRDHRVSINCIPDGSLLLGTGGSILNSLTMIPDSFWVTYGDTLVAADLAAAENRMHQLGCSAIMTVLHNFDVLQPSNTSVDNELVTSYSKMVAEKNFEWIDFGLLYLNKSHFLECPLRETFDLSNIITQIIEDNQLLAWEVFQRFWDIGTPFALQETESELKRRATTR